MTADGDWLTVHSSASAGPHCRVGGGGAGLVAGSRLVDGIAWADPFCRVTREVSHVLTALLIGAVASTASADAVGLTHGIVSFNIRFGSADDGPDRWEVRRAKVVETIRDLDADVIGLQEVEAFQVRELLRALPRYAAVGVHRDDGRLAGEGTPILFDRTRYTLAASETFWLSDTPTVAGSNTWGAACNRTCTWARLLDLESGQACYVFNTHFDHASQAARDKSAALLLERIAERRHDDPAFVTGDLNARPDSSALRVLLGGAGRSQLVDAFARLHPGERGGTYTAFKPESDGGEHRIDYVLNTADVEVVAVGIDRRKIDGRYPSDHFPVWAEVRWRGREG